MQVRQILLASLLVATAVGAMSQEIDRSETLQAMNLAAQQARAQPQAGQTREAVVAEARAAEASGQVNVGERADGLPVDAAPNISWAKFRATKPYAKTWLHGDRKQTHTVVAERG
jgi:hypothetical protein